jgi:hypothetical protein
VIEPAKLYPFGHVEPDAEAIVNDTFSVCEVIPLEAIVTVPVFGVPTGSPVLFTCTETAVDVVVTVIQVLFDVAVQLSPSETVTVADCAAGLAPPCTAPNVNVDGVMVIVAAEIVNETFSVCETAPVEEIVTVPAFGVPRGSPVLFTCTEMAVDVVVTLIHVLFDIAVQVPPFETDTVADCDGGFAPPCAALNVMVVEGLSVIVGAGVIVKDTFSVCDIAPAEEIVTDPVFGVPTGKPALLT